MSRDKTRQVVVHWATDDDRAAIFAVHEAAFGRPLEAEIAQALNEAGDERISLVATAGASIVGHVVVSAGSVGDALVLCLGPIGVLPNDQRSGVGTTLMRAALSAADSSDAGVVVLLGHPTYYPRFGFEPAHPLGLESQWSLGPAWMARRLPRYDSSVQGMVRFPAAFDADNGPA